MENANEILVPLGFEHAHEEWVRQGAKNLKYDIAPRFGYYETEYWKLVRQAVLNRDSGKCCRCDGVANQVHHLSYDFRGEDHLHPQNLVSICRGCHGFVEYGRLAEAIASRIRRRIMGCRGFLEGKPSDLRQTPVLVCSRLVEYRSELQRLQRLYKAKARYSNGSVRSRREGEMIRSQFQECRARYEEEARLLVDSLGKSDEEKMHALVTLLEQEVINCRKFAASVFTKDLN